MLAPKHAFCIPTPQADQRRNESVESQNLFLMAGLTLEKVKGLTVLDLRKELKKAGLDSKGNKAVLVERLKTHVESSGDAKEEEKPEEKPEEKAAEDKEEKVGEKKDEKDDKEDAKKDEGDNNDNDENDSNPLSEARMKRRAERFGLPWPREEGTKRQKLSAKGKKAKEPAIAAFVLTSDEINQREARAKRFASTATDTAAKEAAK